MRGTTVKAKAVEESSSYYEETDAEPSQPSAAPWGRKTTATGAAPQESRGYHPRVSFSPRQRRPKQVSLSLGQEDHSQRSRAPQESRGYQPRVSFSPRQRAQPRIQRSGGQATGQGEPLPSPRTPSRPTTAAAAAENQTSGDQGGKSGEPLPDESRVQGTLPRKRLHPKQSRWMTLKTNIRQNLPKKCLHFKEPR